MIGHSPPDIYCYRKVEIKAIHKKLLDDKMSDAAVIAVVGTMTYRGPTNGERRVIDIELH
jgi:hypothetical protein